jgi:hypothetical protein
LSGPIHLLIILRRKITVPRPHDNLRGVVNSGRRLDGSHRPKSGARKGRMRHLRSLDACVLLLSAVALILVGPLRSSFATFPVIPFVSTLLLFMVPGLVTSRWLLGEHISAAVLVPVSFVLSAGIFAFCGVPVLMAHGSLELYLWIAGGILAASLVATAFGGFRRKPPTENDTPAGLSSSWLWIPFLFVSVVLASVSRTKEPLPYNDIWVYLAWVREFLATDKLAFHEPYFGNTLGASRAQINGWLLEQAALSRVSGIDAVELVLRYLTPTLVIMSLLAFYALARILLKSKVAALLAGCLYVLALLVRLTPRENLLGRVAEDKFTAGFLFLPVALAFAVLFLESRNLRYLMAFAFLCWAVVAVHPVGLAIIGLSAAGFGLLHLAVNWRENDAWIRTASLGAALLSVLLVPALYVLATGDSLAAVLQSADINASDPDVLANMVFVSPLYESRLLELGEDHYMVHPSRLLEPAILVTFSIGLPFLVLRLKRSLAAQLLLGMMLVPAAVCFVPPVATFLGNHVVLPGQMWRLAWPIPLAALLTLGWMIWEAARRAELRLNRLGLRRGITRLLPVAVVIAVMVAGTPVSLDEAKAVYRAGIGTQNSGRCFDPIFHWMRENIREVRVVLAPDMENTCIPAYSANANVVSLRGGLVFWVLPALQRRAPGQIDVPEGALDVQRFFSGSTLAEKVSILRRYEVDYVMLPADSPLDGSLDRQPGFTAIDTPSERYSLYAVDRNELGG